MMGEMVAPDAYGDALPRYLNAPLHQESQGKFI